MIDSDLNWKLLRPFDLMLYAVSLVRDQATGKVLFRHRHKFTDPDSVYEVWGQPIGSAFGTYLEIWVVTETRADLLFPLGDK